MFLARVASSTATRWFRIAAVLISILTLQQRAHAQLYSTSTVSPWEFFIAFCCVLVASIAANAFLVSLVRPVAGRGRWQQQWEFSLSGLGGFSWRSLALWSLLSLFMELLMIRWVASEIQIFAYFKNFILIACFLGFGLGCYLARRPINLLLMFVPLVMLITIVQLPWAALRLMIAVLPSYIGTSSTTHIWDFPTMSSLATLAAATAVIVPIFALIVFCFVPMGQAVGWYLENSSKGTLAYSVNVFAALCGIILYTSLCFLSQPPAIWFLVGDLLLLAVVWTVPRCRRATLLFLVFSLSLLTMPRAKGSQTYWSPYQKLRLTPSVVNGETLAYSLHTNDSWYQQILNLSPQFVQRHPQLFQKVPIEWNAYNIPYHFYPTPPSVLVLGSGMGNDVAAALRNGAGRVTAVEIDPLILKLGKRFHPERPYDSPHVTEVNDDARSYIENTNARFDLVVFSLLDSHTTSSYYTNIRIDNYVYTQEAINATRRLLKPGGVFVLKFAVTTPWIAGRLHLLLSQSFGRPPIQLEVNELSYSSGGRFFVVGAEERLAHALADPSLEKFIEQHSQIPMEAAVATTDDWPYFYQKSRGLPLSVIVISGVLILLCAFLLRDMGKPIRSLALHFFFLGAGFLLLEVQIISRMALLFGTTWLVNSIVIASLLVLILLANMLVGFKPSIPIKLAYIGLLLTLGIGYFVPIRSIFFASVVARIFAATLVLCLPVFFAGIIFMKSFAEYRFSADALGSNLLGAMVGGMLESASLWAGIRFLALLTAALYVASWVSLHRGRSQAKTSPMLASTGVVRS
jgi:spermidine synthase